jgi:hypothetical protein
MVKDSKFAIARTENSRQEERVARLFRWACYVRARVQGHIHNWSGFEMPRNFKPYIRLSAV